MSDTKESAKKFVRDYIVAIIATGLLVIIVLLLVIVRYASLASVKDLSKINPLITSDNNQLVASDNGEISKLAGSAGQNSQSTTQASTTPTPSSSPSIAPSSTTNTSDSTSEPSVPQVFAAGIQGGTIQGSESTVCNTFMFAGACVGTSNYTYTLAATIAASNGPGAVSYTWKAVPTSSNFSTQTSSKTLTVASGTSTNQISMQWTLINCAVYTVSLTITSPANSQKTVTSSLGC